MNYGIGNVKGVNAIPHIIIELSQMLTSNTFQLTNEQYNLIDKNSTIFFTASDGTSFLFKKTIVSVFETLGAIVLTCMMGDIVDSEPIITEYRIGITKSTKIGTFSQNDVNGAIANPILTGDESDLSSIQIGDNKYKIGGGKQLYQHCISFYSDLVRFTTTIINDSPTQLNSVALIQTYLTEKGFIGKKKMLIASGAWYGGGAVNVAIGLFKHASYNELHIAYAKGSDSSITSIQVPGLGSFTVEDTVLTL